MKRMAVVLTMLGLAAPVFADDVRAQAAVLTDDELDQVAAGCDTGSAASPTTNVNISPIVVNQTAVALSNQTQRVGKVGKNGKVKQNATNLAMNYAFINYHVKY